MGLDIISQNVQWTLVILYLKGHFSYLWSQVNENAMPACTSGNSIGAWEMPSCV